MYYKMSLNIILGPMFAGKSSELLGTIRKYNAIGWPILVITHSGDTRYSEKPEIISHDNQKYPALALRDLSLACHTLLYMDARLVIIEEAQFFGGLKDFVLHAVEVDKKDVICVGLDGDTAREPFGELLSLIPYCDTVVKRHAFCSKCKEPNAALFTYSDKKSTDEQVQVGGKELYSPVCRHHYLALIAKEE